MEDPMQSGLANGLLTQNLRQYVRYRPLQGTEIRYVSLQPYRESVGLVECLMRQVPLESATYIALSYSWGDVATTETILVDNHPFQVTTNLASCLKTLSNPPAKWGWPPGLKLWIDALCINQDDISERNRQVLRMTDIYQTAGRVLVWLGPQMALTELAFNRLSEVKKECDQIPQGTNFSHSDIAEMARRLSPQKLPEHSDNIHCLERATQEGLKDLFNRGWWRRTWILQEVAAHIDPVFFCGECYITKRDLLRNLILIVTSALGSGTDGILRLGSQEYSSMQAALCIRGKQATLLELLQFSRASEATDPRDKVYGILGLSSDFSSGSRIAPDYSSSTEEVYTSVVKAYIEKYDNLDIFGSCGYTREGLDLPSWVPDWRSALQTATGAPFEKNIETEDGHRQNVYRASGETLSFGRYRPTIRNKELHLHGCHLDIVEKGDTAADYTHPSQKDVERSWMPQNKNETYALTGETMEKAYLRTIVADFSTSPLQVGVPNSRGFARIWPENAGNSGEIQAGEGGVGQYDMIKACLRRRFAWSRRRWMGLVPEATQIGDSIALLLGGQMLYILRTSGDEGHFKLVGEAYFHGLMDGEAMKMVEGGEFTIDKIVLE